MANQRFQAETKIKNRAIEQLEEIRLNMADGDAQINAANSAKFWKDKCSNVYDLCLEMKDENEYITQKCKDLADLAVSLMNQVQN